MSVNVKFIEPEFFCSWCNASTANTIDWQWMLLTWLEFGWLCEKCAPEYYKRFTFLQENGL